MQIRAKKNLNLGNWYRIKVLNAISSLSWYLFCDVLIYVLVRVNRMSGLETEAAAAEVCGGIMVVQGSGGLPYTVLRSNSLELEHLALHFYRKNAILSDSHSSVHNIVALAMLIGNGNVSSLNMFILCAFHGSHCLR